MSEWAGTVIGLGEKYEISCHVLQLVPNSVAEQILIYKYKELERHSVVSNRGEISYLSCEVYIDLYSVLLVP